MASTRGTGLDAVIESTIYRTPLFPTLPGVPHTRFGLI